MLCLAHREAAAQISLNALLSGTNYTYATNFDGLGTVNSTWTNNSKIPGWYASQGNTGNVPSAFVTNAGNANAGALYNYGLGTDRTLGGLVSGGNTNLAYGVVFTNDTGKTLINFNVTFNGEQWRDGGNNPGVAQTLQVTRAVGAFTAVTNYQPLTATSSVWVATSALDFTSQVATTTAGPLDGSSAANRKTMGPVSLGVTLAPGDSLALRWRDINDAANDHGFAVDDFTVTCQQASTPIIYRGNLNQYNCSNLVQDTTYGNIWKVQIQATNINLTNMLFTTACDFATKFARGSTLNKNSTIGDCPIGAGADLAFDSTVSNFFYSIQMQSNASPRYVVMETTNAPKALATVATNAVRTGWGETDTRATDIALSGNPSGERIYLRWTTNAFATSDEIREASRDVNNASNLITYLPGLNPGLVGSNYYILSAMPSNALDSNADVCTISASNNSDAGYSFQVPTNKVLDQFVYNTGGTLNNSNLGSFWTGSWSAITYTNEAGNLPIASGYPASGGNRIITRPADGVSNTAQRNFQERLKGGRVYASWSQNVQFNGANKHSGLEFVDTANTTNIVMARIGEWSTNDNQLGIEEYGGSQGSAFALSNGSGNDYTIIAVYDFSINQLRAKAYHSGQTIPDAEIANWDATGGVAATKILAISGIRFTSGSVPGGTPGETRFDEIRSAPSWQELLNKVWTPPVATNFTVNVTNGVTDGQMTNGTYPIVLNVRDLDGVKTTDTNWPFLRPGFDLVAPGGNVLITNQAFSLSTNFLDTGRTVVFTDAAHQVAFATNVLGTYSIRWSASDSNGHSRIQYTNVTWGTSYSGATFVVTDDDTNAPAISNVVATSGALGVGTVGVSKIQAAGWSLTGLIQDAISGINSNDGVVTDADNNVSPYFTIFNNTGVVIIATQLFAQIPGHGTGATTGAPVGSVSITNTVTADRAPLGTYTAIIVTVDADADRPGDRLLTSNVYTFVVVDDTNNPSLCYSPATMSFATQKGVAVSPDNQAFFVTNCGNGTMIYTNEIKFSAGASGWAYPIPTNGSLGAGLSAVHTVQLVNATITTLDAGTDTATSRIHAGSAGTNTIVITLLITNAPTISIGGPTQLIYNVMLGDDVPPGSFQTFTVTNTGDGTLTYTNFSTYDI